VRVESETRARLPVLALDGIVCFGQVSYSPYLLAHCAENDITIWQERKQETVTHPFLGEKMPIGMLWHMQALLLARYMRGDLDGDPALLWK
jgi:CRISPR-associated protein Cas1